MLQSRIGTPNTVTVAALGCGSDTIIPRSLRWGLSHTSATLLIRPAGTPAVMKVGDIVVASPSAQGLSKAETKAVKTATEAKIKAALTQAGYPAKADPARMNMLGMFGVLFVFVIAATALFGPLAACLVELFPTRVRYTALSLPYHIGTGWVGGFVPFFAFAIVTAVGNIYAGLWYPVFFTLVSVLTTLFLLPETKGRPLDEV